MDKISLKKILVPLDGSESGELSLAYAKELSVGFDSRVNMVCIPSHSDQETKHMCDLYLDKIIEKTSSEAKSLNEKTVFKKILIDGDTSSSVLEHAENENMDLIILSSHGESGHKGHAMGSNAYKIAHKSKTPILLVKVIDGEKQKKKDVFKNILVPLDGSELGETALPYAVEIAKKLGSKLILLRVTETMMHVRTIGGPDHFTYHDKIVELMEKESVAYLDAVKEKIGSDVSVKTVLKTGDIADEIIKVSEEENADLVALSSHGKSGIARWVMGSITNKLLMSGDTPVMVVRPSKK